MTPRLERAVVASPPIDLTDAPGWREVSASSPAITDARVRDHSAAVPQYGDDRWSLNAMGRAAGQGNMNLHFAHADGGPRNIAVPPPAYRETLKRVAYLMVNEPMPRSYTQRHGTNARQWLAPTTVQNLLRPTREFFAWLDGVGCETLSDCTEDLLAEYHLHVDGLPVEDGRKFALLSAMERLAHLAPLLPEDDRLCAPRSDAKVVLRVGRAAAGSQREVVPPETADPLIAFAVSCIRDLAPDILAAYDCAQALQQSDRTTRGSWDQAVSLLSEMAAADGIPAWVGHGGRTVLAASWLGAVHGLKPTLLSTVVNRKGWRDQLNTDLPTHVPVEVTGRLGGEPWCDGVDWRAVTSLLAAADMPPLLRHLQTFCWLTLAVLSGARPDEVRRLPINPLEVMPPREPGGAVRYILHGALRKGITDEDGRASLDGEARRWVIVGPGLDAVRVATEIATRIHPGTDYLFPSASNEAIGHHTMADRVGDAVRWANDLVDSLGLAHSYGIPTDKTGKWDLSGFRRSLAWHIHEQPGGEMAVALQFQHADTAIGSDGYASVADVGLRNVMSKAARQAHEEMLSGVANMLVQGTHVSGPAAQRLVEAASLANPVLANYTNDREVRALLDTPGTQVFDNPSAYSLCVYVPRLARCLAGADAQAAQADVTSAPQSPDRGACHADCACHARTDREIGRLRDEEAQQRREAESPLTPEPLQHRLRQAADLKRSRIEDHERNRVFIQLEDLRSSLTGGSDGRA